MDLYKTISVIIPSLNQGKYLEETILSVLDQNYPHLEIFVVDGGSTDNSIEIIKKYSDRLTGWVSQKDKGQSDAINYGLQISTGEIVTWLCSDDLYTKGTLHKVNEVFSSLPESVGVIHGNSEIFRDENIIRLEKGYQDNPLERQLSGMRFAQPSSFIKRKKWIEVGLLNTNFHYGMDYDLLARLIMICDFQYVDFCFSRYRLHSLSKSTTAISRFIDEWTIVFNSIVQGFEIKEIMEVLEKLDLKTPIDPGSKDFFKSVKPNRIVENDKMLYHFLTNVIRYDYATGRFKRSEIIGRYISQHFQQYLSKESSVREIINRSRYIPHSFLRMIRKIRRPYADMKIAFVTSHINRSTQWIWFSEELQKRHVQHIHITVNEFKPLLYDDLKEKGVDVYYLKHKTKLSFAVNIFKTMRIFSKTGVNVVHTELPYGNVVGQIAAFLCGIKMRITTCENTTWFSDFDSRKQESIDRLTYMISKKVIALTKESYEYLKGNFNIPSSKMLIIHHSLKASDYLEVKPEEVQKLKTELGIEENKFIIGMVARFEYWKGHVYAIEAIQRLVKEFPDVRMYIFGSEGESFDTVMNQIKESNLEKYISYKGFVHNNIALFKIFDIHLHIPIKLESETFGINVMEGMVSGCAQVLTLAGISSFTAEHEKNCLVVQYQSTQSVYDALKRLILNKEERLRLGKQAESDAVYHFHYEDKVDQHLKLYTQLKSELS